MISILFRCMEEGKKEAETNKIRARASIYYVHELLGFCSPSHIPVLKMYRVP